MVEKKQSPEAVGDDRIVAAIGYVWILCFVPLFLARNNKLAQFHAKQGLVLFIIELGLVVIMIIPILGWLVGFVGGLICLVLSVMGILRALAGEYWEMPYLGEYAKRIRL